VSGPADNHKYNHKRRKAVDIEQVLERLGSEATIELVHKEFGGKSVGEISDYLNGMFPQEADNEELAQAICAVCATTASDVSEFFYVKSTSNCESLNLQTIKRLSPEWTGNSLTLPFGEGATMRRLEVVGWTDLFGGQPCAIHAAQVRWLGQDGFLIWGGNSGVRILDDEATPIEGIDDHLPAGYGRPVIWVEDVADLPVDVQAVVTRHVYVAV